MISHGGGDAGYRSHVAWFPDCDLGVAVVSNLGSFNPNMAALQAAAVYLEEKMTPMPKLPESDKRTYITLKPETLQKYVGVYPLPTIGQTLETVMEEGKLCAGGQIQPPIELKPTGENRFYVEPLLADIEFTPMPDDGMKVKITQPGAVNEGIRTTDDTSNSIDFKEYCGTYWNEELETQYTFFLKEDNLMALHAHHGEFSLMPGMKDSFTSGQWFTPIVIFIRDEEDRVSGVRMGGGRLTPILFNRKG
jgi:hypothetical protein